MPSLEGLNPAQREAAQHKDGPCVVVAGAGSGKTTMLVLRILGLVESGVPPQRILSCTFTKKATEDMRARLEQAMGPRAKHVVVTTIHGLAHRMVVPTLGPGWQLVPNNTWMIEVVLAPKTSVNPYGTGLGERFSPEEVQQCLSVAKNSGWTPGQLSDPDQNRVFDAYERWKTVHKKLDFDDLLVRAHRLLYTDPAFFRTVSSRFQYVLVDEFQDTNWVQWLILQKLVEPHRNLFVVGDDYQSIYGFRGARPELILEFSKYYPDAKIVLLERNYRSTETVVQASNRVIRLSKTQRVKRVVAHRQGGDAVRILACETPEQQALRVVDTIQGLKTAFPELGWSDFAVLYRTNTESRDMEEAFTEAKMPFSIVGDQHFYEMPAVVSVLSYLRVVEAIQRKAPIPPEAVFRSVEFPKKLLSSVAKESLRANGIDVVYREPERFEPYLELLERLLPIEQPSAFLETLKQGVPGWHDSQELPAWWSSLQVASKRHATLRAFLKHVDWVLDQAKEPKPEAIPCMTIHRSKGLEWKTVFVLNVVEGSIPYAKAQGEASALDEETRLFYVAMTRAKDRLYVLYPNTLGNASTVPSRFLRELEGMS
ncbi:MAG: ATP-dependent helicase [Sulfobacillus thermotolerans]|nr:ATP-dependent helicase [Sulfobacillus thermotolerans]